MRTPFVTRLSEAERRECQRYADKVTKIVQRYGPNYTGLHDPQRFFTGKAGEIALSHWCESIDAQYEVTTNDEGRPDLQDIIVTLHDGRRVRVDVKNSLHPNARYLMQPVGQGAKHRRDIYVGAKGIDHGETITVELWGSVTHKEFHDLGEVRMLKVETRQLLLRDLPHSMEELGAKLRTRDNFLIPA